MQTDDRTGRPELWLFRHGETEWSRDRRHTGRSDLPLTAAGEGEAHRLADRLAGVEADLVLTSPLRRARDTAALAGYPDATPEPDALEWDYGAYEGRTTADIRTEVPGWTVWTHPTPGGETVEQVAARVDRVVARVRAEAPRRALLFAHGHVLRVLAARWLDLPPATGARLALDTGTVSVLGWEHEYPAVRRWNG